METCFNCGAEVRAGAKFCTSCGTRLVDNPAAPTTSAADSAPDQPAAANETQIAAPAAPESANGETASSDAFAGWGETASGWNTSQDSSTSPADRFQAALDSEERNGSSTDDQSSGGWGTPAPTTDDRFASWSAAYGTTPSRKEETAEDQDDGEVVSIENATIASPEDETAETDSAGFTDSGTEEVDYLSGDENIAVGGSDSGIAAGRPSDESDARQRATTLVEELRELIWKIGEQQPANEGDMTEVRNALSAARGHTSDFSDLERAISAVRETPRDIDALLQLGSHAGRLEDLLESHSRLTSALDDAIGKMQ